MGNFKKRNSSDLLFFSKMEYKIWNVILTLEEIDNYPCNEACYPKKYILNYKKLEI